MALLDPGVFTDGVNKTASTHHLAIPEALLHSRGLHSGRVTSLTGLRRVTRAEEPTRASEPEPDDGATATAVRGRAAPTGGLGSHVRAERPVGS